MDPHLIELLGDPEFVFDGKGDLLRLGAIAEGGVVEGDSGFNFFSNSNAS